MSLQAPASRNRFIGRSPHQLKAMARAVSAKGESDLANYLYSLSRRVGHKQADHYDEPAL